MNISDTQNTTRPLGFWLKTVDRLLSAEFAQAFEAEGVGRRDWRLLNAVDGAVAPRRPLHAHKLRRLIERGWVTADGDEYALTDEGRAAKERLGVIVDGIRSRLSEAVPAEDLETTLATLEAIARAFGWSEDAPLPRGRKGRGHGRHHRRPHLGRGFGHEHHDDGEPCAHRGHPGHDRHDRRGHPHGRGDRFLKIARFGQRSYERGFEAGFQRGRDT